MRSGFSVFLLGTALLGTVAGFYLPGLAPVSYCPKDKESQGCNIFLIYYSSLPLNPHTPVEQKVADEVVFRRFQGEGVEFFKIGPLLSFLMRFFWKIPI